MGKILFLTILIGVFGCASYPEEPPYLIGIDGFTIENSEKEAPYKYPNKTKIKHNYFTYNLPFKLGYDRSYKDWSIIEKKYKVDLFYEIHKKGNDIYQYRNITKWHSYNEEKVYPLTYLFDILKAEGVTKEECSIIAEKEDNKLNIRFILLLYKGVKHSIRLRPNVIDITSYPESQQAYWETQGQFMMDTPQKIVDKWIEKEKHNP